CWTNHLKAVLQFQLAARCISYGRFCIPSKRAGSGSPFDECSSCNRDCVHLCARDKFQIRILEGHWYKSDNFLLGGVTVSRSSHNSGWASRLSLQSVNGQHFTFVRLLTPPAKASICGFNLLAKIPLGNRLDCLAQLTTSHAPPFPDSSLKASGQLREKDES